MQLIFIFRKLISRALSKYYIHLSVEKVNPKVLLEDIYSFLGIDATFEPPVMDNVARGRRLRKQFTTRHLLFLSFISTIASHSAGISARLRNLRASRLARIYHDIMAGEDYRRLSLEARMRLVEYYREDIKALSQLIDRDQSH